MVLPRRQEITFLADGMVQPKIERLSCLAVTRELGVGSTFRIQLPASVPVPPAERVLAGPLELLMKRGAIAALVATATAPILIIADAPTGQDGRLHHLHQEGFGLKRPATARSFRRSHRFPDEAD